MRLIIEKFPLFTLSFAASVAAFEAQRQLGAVMPVEALSRSDRIDNAVIAYALYIAKTFWPSHLAVIYTHNGSWPFGLVLMAGGFLSAISYFVFRYRRSWPYLIVGWLWFLGTLVPMIGLVQAGAQSMADRYTYISLIGLFFMAVWGSADAARRLSVSKEIVTAFATLVVCVAAVAMRHQLLYWKDSSTLFGHAVFVTCNNWAAHHNLALTLANKLEFEKADVEFARALQITPQNLVVLKSRAKLYLDMGNAERAIEFFEDVISLDPRNIEAHRQLAWIYATCQDPALRNADLTLKHARFVCQASPDADFKQFDVLAVAYAENGQFEDAVAVEQRACTLASVAGEDPKEFQERLKLFKSKQPYRTDFGAKKHKILAKQQAGQADSPVK